MGFEVYPMHEDAEPNNPTGEYGWRRRGRDGEITATGHEGFTREEDAERAIREHGAAVYTELFPTLNNPEMSGKAAAENLEIKRVAA
jgi:hypothetical protein